MQSFFGAGAGGWAVSSSPGEQDRYESYHIRKKLADQEAALTGQSHLNL